MKTYAGRGSVKSPEPVQLVSDTQSSATQRLLPGNVKVSLKSSNSS